MRKTRRQTVLRVFEKIGLGLLVLDGVVYFGALRPLENRVSLEQERFSATRRQVLREQDRLEKLEKFQKELPTADEKIQSFEDDHLPSRRHAYSEAARMLRSISEGAGIELGTVRYKFNAGHGAPLDSVTMDLTAQGSFAALMKFAHALETDDNFVVLREFSFLPGDGGTLSLRLAGDLYLTP